MNKGGSGGGAGKGEKVKKAKSSSLSSSSSLLRPEVAKDPYIEAEEEELKYLERKLGLTGE